MTRILRLLVLSGVMASGVMASGVARAEPPPPPHAVITQNAAELGIDAETAAQIVQIAEANRTQRDAFEARIEAARAEVHALLQADEPDRAQVMAAIDRLGAVELARHKAQIGFLLDIRALLTPEQREKVRDLGGGGLDGPARGGPPPGGPPPGGPPPGGPPR